MSRSTISAFFLLVSAVPAFSTTWYVTPGGTGDGTAWASSLGSVSAALHVAASGDEVWVANGTYAERVLVPGGVGLYGGFHGNETQREARTVQSGDLPTVLDGGGQGSVITVAPNAPASTVIEQFVVTHGSGTVAGTNVLGGGIYCGVGSSPTIRLNRIEQNTLPDTGGSSRGAGVYCASGSRPSLLRNSIEDNTADDGAGVFVEGAAPVLDHNDFSGNSARGSGGALAINSNGSPNGSAAPMALRNTFRNNSAAGRGTSIYVDNAGSESQPIQIFSNLVNTDKVTPGSSNIAVSLSGFVDLVNNTILNCNLTAVDTTAGGKIVHNIITGNTYGIKASPSMAASIRHNDVYSNAFGNYISVPDQTGINGNVSFNPGFGVNPGDIGGSSYLVDAGSLLELPSGELFTTDIGGNPRIFGGQVDIGANEVTGQLQFDPGPSARNPKGVAWPAAVGVRVLDQYYQPFRRFSGSVTLSLNPATGTAGAALSGVLSGQVSNGGVAFGQLAVDKGGTGYQLTAASPGMTPLESGPFAITVPHLFVSVTSGNDRNEGVAWDEPKKSVAAGLAGVPLGSGEVWVAAGDYREGRLRLPDGVGLYGGFAGTESARNQRRPTVNASVLHGGLDIGPARQPEHATLDGFTITDGRGFDIFSSPSYAYYAGGGIAIVSASPTISGNVITGNTATLGGGIFAQDSASIIRNNQISGNSVTPGSGVDGEGGGIFISAASAGAEVANNTIAENTASDGGGGAFLSADETHPIRFVNNIVAFNNSGVSAVGDPPGTSFSHNLVFGNGLNFSGVADPSGSNGNQTSDPLFADRAAGDFRLSAGSPAVDAGEDGTFGDYDVDGNPRHIGLRTDIGAYEFGGVNQSGVGDAIVALRIAAGLNASDAAQRAHLDVTGPSGPDGVVDIRDAAAILRGAIGLSQAS